MVRAWCGRGAARPPEPLLREVRGLSVSPCLTFHPQHLGQLSPPGCPGLPFQRWISGVSFMGPCPAPILPDAEMLESVLASSGGTACDSVGERSTPKCQRRLRLDKRCPSLSPPNITSVILASPKGGTFQSRRVLAPGL